MYRSSIRRAAGAVAMATVAGLMAAPTLHAGAATATRAATSLSIRVAHASIKPGGTDRVSGHLAIRGSVSAAGRTVVLEARPRGVDEFVPIGEATTGPRGGVRLTVSPDVTTRYRWRYAGADDARPSRSGVARVRVRENTHPPRRLPTSLSIRAIARVGKTGTVDIVRGVVKSRRVRLNRPVILLSRTAGGDAWVFEGVKRSGRRGVVRFRVDPDATTAYRLVFLGSRLLRPARSGVVRVPVRPDVTIAADPISVPKGASVTVSGVATLQGAALAGTTIKLWARKAGRPHSGKVVDSAVTADDGSVSFVSSPRVTTRYRLIVTRSDTSAGTVSASVRVRVVAPAGS